MTGQFAKATLLAALSGLPPPPEEEPLDEMPPLAPSRKAVGRSKPLTPKNVVALAKARLRDVKSELRRMKALEKERGELERLIEAATNKPRVAREPKRPAG